MTAIKKITQENSSVYVCGPTGAAAFNAGGETCHWLFNIKPKPKSYELPAKDLKALIAKLRDIMALIVDERSMVSSLLLGTIEAYCRQAALGGNKSHLSWGGIPIVILFEDDYQLPPPIDEGAFYCLEEPTRRFRNNIEQLFS